MEEQSPDGGSNRLASTINNSKSSLKSCMARRECFFCAVKFKFHSSGITQIATYNLQVEDLLIFKTGTRTRIYSVVVPGSVVYY